MMSRDDEMRLATCVCCNKGHEDLMQARKIKPHTEKWIMMCGSGVRTICHDNRVPNFICDQCAGRVSLQVDKATADKAMVLMVCPECCDAYRNNRNGCMTNLRQRVHNHIESECVTSQCTVQGNVNPNDLQPKRQCSVEYRLILDNRVHRWIKCEHQWQRPDHQIENDCAKSFDVCQHHLSLIHPEAQAIDI